MDPILENIEKDEEKETPEKTITEPVEDSGIDDLKQKLIFSSNEGVRLAKDLKASEEEKERLKIELEDLKASSEISLDETMLSKRHPDWELLGDADRVRIREMEQLKARQDKLDAELNKQKREAIKAEEARRFESSYNKVIGSYPDLKGKEKEFKEFCYRDDNLGNTNLEVLAKSFLFDSVKIREKREGLESATGGEKKAPKPDGFTTEEALALMKSNPRKYNEMVRDGKLKLIK